MRSVTPGGVLYIFWVRGRAIGKGIDFHDFGIRNGINFRNFAIGIGSGMHFWKIGIRNGYVFETSMARPRPKSDQVPPRVSHQRVLSVSSKSCFNVRVHFERRKVLESFLDDNLTGDLSRRDAIYNYVQSMRSFLYLMCSLTSSSATYCIEMSQLSFSL